MPYAQGRGQGRRRGRGRGRGGGRAGGQNPRDLQNVHDTHVAFDALGFPLLFPNAEDCFNLYMKLNPNPDPPDWAGDPPPGAVDDDDEEEPCDVTQLQDAFYDRCEVRWTCLIYFVMCAPMARV